MEVGSEMLGSFVKNENGGVEVNYKIPQLNVKFLLMMWQLKVLDLASS